MLDSAVRKSNRVGSLGIAGTIRGLLGVEVGLGVVIGNGVGVGVGGNLIGVNLSLVGRGGCMVSRGSVDGVSHGVGDNRGVDSVSHGVDSVVGNGVNGVGSNHRGVDSVSQGSVDSVSNHGRSVGDNSGSNMGGEVSTGVGNTANDAGSMMANVSG